MHVVFTIFSFFFSSSLTRPSFILIFIILFLLPFFFLQSLPSLLKSGSRFQAPGPKESSGSFLLRNKAPPHYKFLPFSTIFFPLQVTISHPIASHSYRIQIRPFYSKWIPDLVLATTVRFLFPGALSRFFPSSPMIRTTRARERTHRSKQFNLCQVQISLMPVFA